MVLLAISSYPALTNDLLGEPLRLSAMVNDFSSALQSEYAKDLNRRLRHFNDQTGYAIVIVVISNGEGEQISQFISKLFAENGLEKWGVAGTVLVLITVQEGWVIVEPSQKLEKKFLTSWAAQRIEHLFKGESQNREHAIERRVQAVLEIIDPWFYVLDPPSTNSALGLSRPPTAEIILFPLAPLLGLVVGAVLMAFTSAGNLPTLGRFFVSGILACVVVLVTAFLIRQRGEIAPGIICYGAIASFLVGAIVGITRPFWFVDTIRGRKPGEKIHPPFYGIG